MTRELIEKIESFRKKNIDIAPIREEIIGYNNAIDDVLKAIESYKPKVLDQPDSKGWWWVYDDIEEEWFPIFIHVPGAVIVNIDSDRWIKADTSIFPMKIAGKG
jgi:hypothetical protein